MTYILFNLFVNFYLLFSYR